jgi:hypothetical protein
VGDKPDERVHVGAMGCDCEGSNSSNLVYLSGFSVSSAQTVNKESLRPLYLDNPRLFCHEVPIPNWRSWPGYPPGWLVKQSRRTWLLCGTHCVGISRMFNESSDTEQNAPGNLRSYDVELECFLTFLAHFEIPVQYSAAEI